MNKDFNAGLLVLVVIGLLVTVSITGCGYTQRATEAVGQVKKIHNLTPLICPDFKTADISLGFMKDGVGSISQEDMTVLITNEQEDAFKKAQQRNKIVKITYNVKRVTFCVPDHQVTKIEELK